MTRNWGSAPRAVLEAGRGWAACWEGPAPSPTRPRHLPAVSEAVAQPRAPPGRRLQHPSMKQLKTLETSLTPTHDSQRPKRQNRLCHLQSLLLCTRREDTSPLNNRKNPLRVEVLPGKGQPPPHPRGGTDTPAAGTQAPQPAHDSNRNKTQTGGQTARTGLTPDSRLRADFRAEKRALRLQKDRDGGRASPRSQAGAEPPGGVRAEPGSGRADHRHVCSHQQTGEQGSQTLKGHRGPWARSEAGEDGRRDQGPERTRHTRGFCSGRWTCAHLGRAWGAAAHSWHAS